MRRLFFAVYKDLEGKETKVDEFGGPQEATRIIENCISNYNLKFGQRSPY